MCPPPNRDFKLYIFIPVNDRDNFLYFLFSMLKSQFTNVSLHFCCKVEPRVYYVPLSYKNTFQGQTWKSNKSVSCIHIPPGVSPLIPQAALKAETC